MKRFRLLGYEVDIYYGEWGHWVFGVIHEKYDKTFWTLALGPVSIDWNKIDG